MSFQSPEVFKQIVYPASIKGCYRGDRSPGGRLGWIIFLVSSLDPFVIDGNVDTPQVNPSLSPRPPASWADQFLEGSPHAT